MSVGPEHGTQVTEAAQAAGVSRQTVSEWSNHHGPFQSELSERRDQALRDVQQRLEEAAAMAVEVLAQLRIESLHFIQDLLHSLLNLVVSLMGGVLIDDGL